MTKQSPKAIFIDIDGTLMGKNSDALSENLAVIQKVRSLGHLVFINTGRSTVYIPKNLDILRNFDGVISGGGAIVRFGEEELFRQLMNDSAIEKFSQYIIANKLPGFLEGEKNMYHFGFCKYPVDDTWTKIDETNLSEIVSGGAPIEKFTILCEIPEEFDGIMGEDYVVLRFPTYGEILQKACGKGQALLKTIKKLGIPIENSIAIGDSMNDYDMLERAGFGVAMGNADERLKKIADMVTKDVDESGVAYALRKLFEI